VELLPSVKPKLLNMNIAPKFVTVDYVDELTLHRQSLRRTLNLYKLTSLCHLREKGYVFIGISLSVCNLAGLRKKYSTDFHKIR